MVEHPHVQLIEVGPRDGLQFESALLSTSCKRDIITCLLSSGLREIQVTSFVHPQRVPQMADAEKLLASLQPPSGVLFSALVLNDKGLSRALKTNVDIIEISVSASDTHSRKNTGMSRKQALEQAEAMITRASDSGFRVRASIQCTFGCVYEGDISETVVVDMSRACVQAGCDYLVLADTTGMGSPESVTRLVHQVGTCCPVSRLGLHMHDTLGLGLVNVVAGLESGIRRFDTSCGGMGGCPFLPGAAGNIATEDTAYLLHRMGYSPGVDLDRITACTQKLEKHLGRRLPAKARTDSRAGWGGAR